MKLEEAVEVLFKALPFPEHITDIEFSDELNIYFAWRGSQLKFSYRETPFVTRILDDCDHGDDLAIVVQELFKRQHAALILSEEHKK